MNALIRTSPAWIALTLATGCTMTTIVQMKSVETPSMRSPAVLAGSRIAILPTAARVGSQRYLARISAGESVYLQRIGPVLDLKSGADIDRIFREQADLTPAYNTILQKLLDRDSNLVFSKEDTQTVIDPEPWNGKSGINYENLIGINDPVSSRLPNSMATTKADVRKAAPKIRLQWNVSTKNMAKYEPLPLQSVQLLAKTLECDYLLIPVVKDSYIYVKNWYAAGLIPLPIRTTTVNRMNDLAFYLVDGTSGEVVKALQNTQGAANEEIVIALLMHKMIQKGNAFGSFTFK